MKKSLPMSRFSILIKFAAICRPLSIIRSAPKFFRLFWAQLKINSAWRFGKPKKNYIIWPSLVPLYVEFLEGISRIATF